MMPFSHCLYILATATALLPFYHLHRTQIRIGQRRIESAHLKGVQYILRRTMDSKRFYESYNDPRRPSEGEINTVLQDSIDILGVLDHSTAANQESSFDDKLASILLNPSLLESTFVLCSSETTCIFCRTETPSLEVALKRTVKIKTVKLITRSNRKVRVRLVVLHCSRCKANYYPDRITRTPPGFARRQFMLYGAQYIPISKPGRLWVDRSLAVAQAEAILQHQSYLGFSTWYNRSYGGTERDSPSLNPRQSQRLFAEHLIRLLGEEHPDEPIFSTKVNPKTEDIVKEAVQRFVGTGIIHGALEHQCPKCTHDKR